MLRVKSSLVRLPSLILMRITETSTTIDIYKGPNDTWVGEDFVNKTLGAMVTWQIMTLVGIEMMTNALLIRGCILYVLISAQRCVLRGFSLVPRKLARSLNLWQSRIRDLSIVLLLWIGRILFSRLVLYLVKIFDFLSVCKVLVGIDYALTLLRTPLNEFKLLSL